MAQDGDACPVRRQGAAQELVGADGTPQAARVVPQLADLGRRFVHERKVPFGGSHRHRGEQRIVETAAVGKRGNIQPVPLHEHVQAGGIAASHFETIDARQSELDGVHRGYGCRPRVRTGEVDDRLGRAQPVAADRPAGVLEPDDTPVERLQIRSAQAAGARVCPALEAGDSVVDRRQTGAQRVDRGRLLDQRLHAGHASQRPVHLFQHGSRLGQVADEIVALGRRHEAGRGPHPLGQPGRLGSRPRGRPGEDGDDAAHSG